MPRPLGIPHARKPSAALDTNTALYALEHLRRRAMDAANRAATTGNPAQSRRAIDAAFVEAAGMISPNLIKGDNT